MVKRYQQIRCQESGHDRDSLLLATLLPQERGLLACQARKLTVSTCIALALIWQQASSPNDLTKVLLFIWRIRGDYERKRDTQISPNCLQNLWAIFQSKSSAMTAALPKTLGSTLHSWCSPEFNAFTEFLLKIIWRNSCRVEVRDLKLNHAEIDLSSGESQPAFLLHWYANRPAGSMILQMVLSTCWIRGHHGRKPDTQISTSCHQFVWAVFQSKCSATNAALPKRLGWIYTAFNAFSALRPKMIWNTFCKVEVGNLKLNHAETDLSSGESQPALLLHWYANRPAGSMILQMVLSTCWISGHHGRKPDTQISTSCHQLVWAVFQSKCSATNAALPKRLGWIYTAFTPFTAFNAFRPKMIWYTLCKVEVGNLKLNHAET